MLRRQRHYRDSLGIWRSLSRFFYLPHTHLSELSCTQTSSGCAETLLFPVICGLSDPVTQATSSSLLSGLWKWLQWLETSFSFLLSQHSVVRNALFCLETATQAKEINTYTKALLAFAFALAGKEDKKQEMLRLLDEEAVAEADGSLHWQRPGKQEADADLPFHRLPRAPSAEVEMTAYVLLAYLTKQPAPSQEEQAKCARIVKWLVKQQNPTGGFSSTQDTVVALQALSLYGALTYSRSSTGTDLSVHSGANALGTFHVDNTNRLLLQCRPLPQVPGDYNVEATGDRCVYIQTTLKYNVHPRPEDSPFKLDVYTVPESCVGPKAQKTFDVAVNVSYIGKRPNSNMVIIDVKMLSGFIPVKSTVRQVKRTEVSTNHVLLYLEKVNNVTQSLSFTVEQDVPVQHLKPALVKVYDYYETGKNGVQLPCNEGQHRLWFL
uniref:Alpha-macroglobulin receptor-binding domain-containing protein n=1 Tax=Podarcis muralis TaxID=64176 RepID=A0A670HR82_PODMU